MTGGMFWDKVSPFDKSSNILSSWLIQFIHIFALLIYVQKNRGPDAQA